MKLTLVALGTIAGLATLSFAAGADHDPPCNGVVTAYGTPAGTLYVDDRGEDTGPWVYLESNGVEGLQSGGDAITGLYDDGCAHENPDTLIY